jgi:uncharacterized membrane protein YhhN
MTYKKLNILFFVTASIYLLTVAFTPYYLDFLSKILPIVVLLALCVSQFEGTKRMLISSALIASGIGDVLLALSIENGFVFGLGAFLVAQLIYSIIFFKCRDNEKASKQRIGLAIGVVFFSIIMANYILPATAELFIPVAVYLTVITMMMLSALLFNMPIWTVIGAFSFIASDSLLAQSIFKLPVELSTHLIMFTYYAAQFFIVNGLRTSGLVKK